MMMCPSSRTRLIREAEASCSGVPPPFTHRWCPEGKSDRGGRVEAVEYQRFTDDLVAWAIRDQADHGLLADGPRNQVVGESLVLDGFHASSSVRLPLRAPAVSERGWHTGTTSLSLAD